jgi:hypothetical protein
MRVNQFIPIFYSGGNPYETEYQAVLDYATAQGFAKPTTDQQLKQNQLLKDLKTAGIWAKLDTFAVFANNGGANFGLIDWKRLTTYTGINSPTFVSNIGFNSNGTSSYIDLNYNASTAGVNYKLNDACFGAYVTPLASNGSLMHTSQSRSLMRNNANAFNGINSGNAVANALTFGTAKIVIHDRSSSANYQRIGDTSILETVAQTSSGLPTNMWILRDTYTFSVNTQIFKFAFAGASLSSFRSNLSTALNNYLTGL